MNMFEYADEYNEMEESKIFEYIEDEILEDYSDFEDEENEPDYYKDVDISTNYERFHEDIDSLELSDLLERIGE